jgi:hypothetical protein
VVVVASVFAENLRLVPAAYFYRCLYVGHYGFLLKTLVICCPGASDFTFIHERLKNKEKC